MQDLHLETIAACVVGASDSDTTDAGFVPRRLPAFTRLQVPEEMQRVICTPSGVRIEFSSDTTQVQFDAHLSLLQAGRRVPAASVDLMVDGELVQTQSHDTGDVLRLVAANEMQRTPGPAVCYQFDALGPGTKHIALWLPINAVVEVRGLRIDADASFGVVTDERPTWIHHGSSISQCSEAASPTQTWPAVAAQLGGVSLRSLGFGGQCHLDQFVARSIRDQPASFISLKIGINIVNQNSLGRRAFASALHGFLDTIRDGHPTTPLILISPIFCPFSEDMPGPTTASIQVVDGSKRLVFAAIPGHEAVRQNALSIKQMRTIISDVVAARQQDGDSALAYVDGLDLFSSSDASDLPDNLHPNAAGYIRMGQRFADIAFAGGLFNRLSAGRTRSD